MQGWLKAINHPMLQPADPGSDGVAANTANDAFGMQLGYFAGDFVNSGSVFDASHPTQLGALTTQRNLYNGNISRWSFQSQSSQAGGMAFAENPLGLQYEYDLLNRIKTSQFNTFAAGQTDPLAGSWQGQGSDYATSYSYDGNGNLRSLSRYNQSSTEIDGLQYHYYADKNQLKYVTDSRGQVIGDDLASQSAGNYAYDAIGNLTKDNSEGVTDIVWTVYGKVQEVAKADNSTVRYAYDASGNRVKKQVSTASGTRTTYYVRDASGNMMGVYQDEGVGLQLTEQPIYGSERIGLYEPALVTAGAGGNDDGIACAVQG